MAKRTNWAGNHTYRARSLHRPRTVDQLQELVRRTPRIKVLGSRHSFNDIADTDGDQVSLDAMPRTVQIDPAASTVTVDGAVRYGHLTPALDAAGFAFHNLASLPHISVVGACVTATHGSGDRSGNLATAVRSLELVTGTGELRRFDRDADPDTFHGVVVGLGALGVVTRATLDVEPAFRMRQDVYQDLPFERIAGRFDTITSAADHVSLFTTWRGPTLDQVWLKRRLIDADDFAPPTEFHGARRATEPLHPVPTMSPVSTTDQLGVPGPWYERIPHFRMDHTPSAGEELQTEYFVPRARAPAALAAIDAIRDRVGPLVQTSEIRTIAADDLWLSPAFARDAVGIHFTWLPDWPGVSAVLPVLDELLGPFDPRPHWAKLFTLRADRLRATYPQLPAFRELRNRLDPERRFSNAYLERTID